MDFGPQEAIWITGAAGRMGTAIESHLDHSKYRILTTDVELDVTDLNAVMDFASVNRPDFIINCAGMARKQDAAERPVEAYRINALGARNCAIASASVGGTIVHLSTDDVFPGKMKAKVNEFDPAMPLEVYGKSKLAGEDFVRTLNTRHIVVRSSWVYCNREGDLFTRILEAGKNGSPLTVPANQVASPTSVDTYARFIISAMESDEFGLFHATTENTCSRFEFAKRVLELAGLPTDGLSGSYEPEDAYHIDLENLMIKMTGVFDMPTWEEDLASFMKDHGLAR